MKQYPDRVEDYTNAFWVTVTGILFMAFWTIASTAGFVWVVILSVLLDRGLYFGLAYFRTRQISKDRRRGL